MKAKVELFSPNGFKRLPAASLGKNGKTEKIKSHNNESLIQHKHSSSILNYVYCTSSLL